MALLFGREDRGLGNEALDLCHAAAVIPTNPEYSSINLAQAALLLSYEIFLAAGGEGGPLPRGRRHTRPATVEELENTYAALEKGLHRIEFFKAREPAAITAHPSNRDLPGGTGSPGGGNPERDRFRDGEVLRPSH